MPNHPLLLFPLLLICLSLLSGCTHLLRPVKPTLTLPHPSPTAADREALFTCAIYKVAFLNERFKREQADGVADIGQWQIDQIQFNPIHSKLSIGQPPEESTRYHSLKQRSTTTHKSSSPTLQRQYYSEILLKEDRLYLRTWAYAFPPIVPNQIKKVHQAVKRGLEECLPQKINQ